MYKIDVEINEITGDKVYKTVLSNGLRLYINQKKGFVSKVGMFGTVYGSIDNDFIDISSGQRQNVPNGIAHLLEHKLFEQEGDNVLDVFAKMGVDANAYTSFDHTVYYFETDKEFDICLEKLYNFVSNPYFTDENVEKEKGIIGQEIMMHEDNSNSVIYDNLMEAMYIEHPIKTDIIGTIKSISQINKELLYTCYNTFYNPKNMFFLAIGDIDVEETIKTLEKEIIRSSNYRKAEDVERFFEDEPRKVAKKEIDKKMSIHTPVICIGFKMDKKDGKTNVKNEIITDYINEICFSNMSAFYERLYKENVLTHEPEISYESGETFAHLVISAYADNIEIFEKEVVRYIEKLKTEGIDKNLFEIVKLKKEGEYIYNLESSNHMYRSIIESILQKVDVFSAQKILEEISVEDIDHFISESLDITRMCVSRVIAK